MKTAYMTINAGKVEAAKVSDEYFYHRPIKPYEKVEFIPLPVEAKRTFAYRQGYTAIGYDPDYGWYCYN